VPNEVYAERAKHPVKIVLDRSAPQTMLKASQAFALAAALMSSKVFQAPLMCRSAFSSASMSASISATSR
jgi:hypothetical protein